MGSIESFNHNFDKKALPSLSGSWTATEMSSTANFCSLEFFKRDIIFHPINNHFISEDKFVHSDTGKNLRDKNCDGACVWLNPDLDNAEILMLVELKSKFSDTEIRDAFTQTIFSFLRLHMTMSLCEGYDARIQQVRLCVGCQTYDRDSGAKVFDRIKQASEAGLVGFNTRILRFLLKGRPVRIEFRTLLNYFGFTLRLPEYLLNKQVELYLYLTDAPEDTSLRVAL